MSDSGCFSRLWDFQPLDSTICIVNRTKMQCSPRGVHYLTPFESLAPINQDMAVELVCERCAREETTQARMRRAIDLKTAQSEIASNWIEAYQKYVAKSPPIARVREVKPAP